MASGYYQQRKVILGFLLSTQPTKLLETLRLKDYSVPVERAILFQVEAISENCPQHIPLRYSEAEVAAMIAPLQARIAELEKSVVV